MKQFIMAILLVLSLIAGISQAVTLTTVTPVELGSTPVIDSTVAASNRFLTWRIPMTSDSGLTFVNDDRTFILLFDSSGSSASTVIPKPTATLRTAFGDLTISDITITTVSALGNFALIHVPTRYNVSGKLTIYTSSGDYVNMSVFRLAKYEK